MNYMVELFNVYGVKTFMVDSIVEAYEYFFSAKDSKKISSWPYCGYYQ